MTSMAFRLPSQEVVPFVLGEGNARVLVHTSTVDPCTINASDCPAALVRHKLLAGVEGCDVN